MHHRLEVEENNKSATMEEEEEGKRLDGDLERNVVVVVLRAPSYDMAARVVRNFKPPNGKWKKKKKT